MTRRRPSTKNPGASGRHSRARLALVGLLLMLFGGVVIKGRFVRYRDHSQDRVILEAAARYKIDPALMKAVVWRESRFRPMAVGGAGEIGLMQLMDPAAQEWAETVRVYPLPESHLFDPRTNALAGAWYLRKLLQRYRDADDPVPFALADYNAGRGNVLKWARGEGATNSRVFIAQIGFPSTREYVTSVIQRWKLYQQEGDAASASP